jgi:hypothetical protein
LLNCPESKRERAKADSLELDIFIVKPFLSSNSPMGNVEIKYGFIVYINATLAISEFDDKKVIFFILVTGGQSDQGTK